MRRKNLKRPKRTSGVLCLVTWDGDGEVGV